MLPVCDHGTHCAHSVSTLVLPPLFDLKVAEYIGFKSGKFGHQVNSDTYLQTMEIQMRRLLMSRLIRIFTVCLVNLFFISITEVWLSEFSCLSEYTRLYPSAETPK